VRGRGNVKHDTSAAGIDEPRRLLNRIPALQRPCDLDVLLFFARHWRTILTSEQLARLLGYPLKEIARSRDALVAAGLLSRVQDPARPERMYVLDRESRTDGPVTAIVALASAPGGRSSLRRALLSAAAGDSGGAPLRNDTALARAARPPLDAGPKRSGSREQRASAQPERTQ
jgi:hypothetical protein